MSYSFAESLASDSTGFDPNQVQIRQVTSETPKLHLYRFPRVLQGSLFPPFGSIFKTSYTFTESLVSDSTGFDPNQVQIRQVTVETPKLHLYNFPRTFAKAFAVVVQSHRIIYFGFN